MAEDPEGQRPGEEEDGGGGAEAAEARAVAEERAARAVAVDEAAAALEVEVDSVSICGLDLRVSRRRGDFFAACAGDLPIRQTGVVLWECGLLLADYLGYARWLRPGGTGSAASATATGAGPAPAAAAAAAAPTGACAAEPEVGGTDCGAGDADLPPADAGTDAGACDGLEEFSPHPWWMTHPPAPVVPSRFWSAQRSRVLELGGGCGLVTAVLASLGARVVCTDCDPAALRTARQNCSEAQKRYGVGARGNWGSAAFAELRWGDDAAARRLATELGPFSFIVGSDLLYGDASPPEPLLETLAALASEPNGRDAEVVLAVKSRCTDEAERFCRLARERGLWSVRLGDHGDFLDGYQGDYTPDGGGPEVPAYNVIHLRPLPPPPPEAAPGVAPETTSEAAPDDAPCAEPDPKRRRA